MRGAQSQSTKQAVKQAIIPCCIPSYIPLCTLSGCCRQEAQPGDLESASDGEIEHDEQEFASNPSDQPLKTPLQKLALTALT